MGTFWGPDFSELERVDPEIAGVVLGELERQRGRSRRAEQDEAGSLLPP
jgi:hypothetical protein